MDFAFRRAAVAAAVVAGLALSGLLAPAAQADCSMLAALFGCVTTAPYVPPPDPGGTESPNQPVPMPGKGFGFNQGYPASGSPATALQALAATGAQYLRLGIAWESFPDQTSPPSELSVPLGQSPSGSTLAFYDREYLDLTGAGITPIFIVDRTPLWFSTLKDCANAVYELLNSQKCGGTTNPPQPLYPDPSYYGAWRSFVAAIAQRYPKAIIEGPNEPDWAWDQHQQNNINPGAVDPPTAAAIQCQVFQAVRSIDNRVVLSSGLSQSDYYPTFMKSAHGCYDAFSYHAYPNYSATSCQGITLGSNSPFAAAFQSLRGARSSAGDTTPIWVSETGFAYTPQMTDSKSTADRTQEQACADLSQRLYNKLMTMSDVNAVLFHTLIDTSDHFGFLNSDWTPKYRMCTFVAQHGGSYPGCPIATSTTGTSPVTAATKG